MKKRSFIKRSGDTIIVPISVKILGVFTCLLLLSNFTTNFINIELNQRQFINQTNTILVSQLKEIFINASTQMEIYRFSSDKESAVSSLVSVAQQGFSNEHSLAAGIYQDGSFLFSTSAMQDFNPQFFIDEGLVSLLNELLKENKLEGSVRFNFNEEEYLGVYKFHEDWDCFIIRAENLNDMFLESRQVFGLISLIICILVVIFLFLGFILFARIFRYFRQMNDSLHKMQQEQAMGLLDLTGAPNDDISYFGASFNSLSVTINNLLKLFKKFVSQDVVEKAYSEHTIRLEGQQKELSILFSDIRGFTYMTETLGNDIINLLNIHYDKAIKAIHEENGVVGSIIGDAVLAVYGAVNSYKNKSFEALQSAWRITIVTAELREKFMARRVEIEKTRQLTETEKRVFDAVMIDVGVGIDGGRVFYGNIGSSEHMTNTVIGDNVNSASRFEGLTRVYKLPVLISEYVKDDVLSVTGRYKMFEIDTVQVKGKTEGKKVYFPLDTQYIEEPVVQQFECFSKGLVDYYKGNWKEAQGFFRDCKLEVGKVFLERIKNKKVPEDWNGIWTMTTK